MEALTAQVAALAEGLVAAQARAEAAQARAEAAELRSGAAVAAPRVEAKQKFSGDKISEKSTLEQQKVWEVQVMAWSSTCGHLPERMAEVLLGQT